MNTTAPRDMIRLSFDCETKAVDNESRTVDVIMSTDSIDRSGERVAQDWNLSSYQKNPCVLWAHDSKSLPIGRAENVRVERGALRCRIRFASQEANPFADQCYRLFKEGVLNAVSVGFIPHAHRLERVDGKDILVLEKNELIELSATPTPMNGEALAELRSRALAHRSDTTAAERSTETIMAEEITKAALESKDRELTEAKKHLEAERAKIEAFEGRIKALEAATESQMQRAMAAELKLVERDLDGLIGTKIAPAEKPGLVKLAALSPELYAEQLIAIKSRADMNLLTKAMPEEKGTPAPSVGAVDGSALAARLEKLEAQQ